MDDRECEKCEGKVPRGLGLCPDCGWENDLKYFVRTKPNPVLTADEISHLQQRSYWQLLLPATGGVACLCMFLAIAGLCVYWGRATWIGFLIAPASVLIHTLLFALLVWIGSSSEEKIVQGEGGALFYWGKCLAVALIAHASFLVLVAPIRHFSSEIQDSLMISMIYSFGWLLVIAVIAAPGWFAAIQFYFTFPVIWGVALTGMMLGFEIAVCGFVVWLFCPLEIHLFRELTNMF